MTDLFQWNYDPGTPDPEFVSIGVRSPIEYPYPALDRADAWRDEAACREVGLEPFFPDKGERTAIHHAKALCARCPSRLACLEAGMNERHGVWGGTTEQERRILRRQRREAS